ncbi:MAG: hypothetical protein AB7D36_05590 [Oscillospiraceae bacterium]
MHKCIRRLDGFKLGSIYREASREYGKVTMIDGSGAPRTIGAYLFAGSFKMED